MLIIIFKIKWSYVKARYKFKMINVFFIISKIDYLNVKTQIYYNDHKIF